MDYTTYNIQRYMRLEYHDWQPDGRYMIRNEVYNQGLVGEGNIIGAQVALSTVPRWANLTPSITFANVREPLFAVLNMPMANTIDPLAPMGVSIFSRAESLIEQADRMYSQLIWEMVSGARALYVHHTAFMSKDTEPGFGFEKSSLAFRRMYRTVETPTEAGAGLFEEWSPNLREVNYTNALNTLLQRVENACELSRGTFSAPVNATQLGAKTATELKMQMHETHSTVSGIRDFLRPALKRVVNAMYAWTQLTDVNGNKLYNMCPAGFYEVNTEFDDSLITDTALQFVEYMQMLSQGVVSATETRGWYFGEEEEEATRNYEAAQEELIQRQGALVKIKTENSPPGRGTLEPGNNANNPTDDGALRNSAAS
jgi:A118 family predicted phage portal protein